jgi:hypothetical protein
MNQISRTLAACLVVMLTGTAAFGSGMASRGASIVDPPVVLTNNSDQALIIKWQTSIPGVAASPVEHRVLPVGERQKHINHANFWVTEAEPAGDVRGVTNMIEIWVYGEDNPDLLVSSFVTYRDLYASDFAESDKSVILEIVISPTVGIDVMLVDEG